MLRTNHRTLTSRHRYQNTNQRDIVSQWDAVCWPVHTGTPDLANPDGLNRTGASTINWAGLPFVLNVSGDAGLNLESIIVEGIASQYDPAVRALKEPRVQGLGLWPTITGVKGSQVRGAGRSAVQMCMHCMHFNAL